ncbi:MAG TPA: riboflavin synthase [Chryseosolibacter sp.]
MFTGIIETIGSIEKIRREGTNTSFFVKSSLAPELKVDQSVSHSGVCLTVTAIENEGHWVTAIRETLDKSALGKLSLHSEVNLERCMLNNGRFDGHIVQGHVDQTGIVQSIKGVGGSWLFDIEYDPSYGNVTVEKGSIAVNGVSLTCFNSRANSFTVAIIPYTFQHTNFHQLHLGDSVNLEFDIIGKYVKKLLTPGS